MENDEEDYRNSPSYKRFAAMMNGGGEQPQPTQAPAPAQATGDERLQQLQQMAAKPSTNPLLTGKSNGVEPPKWAARTSVAGKAVDPKALGLKDSDIAAKVSIAMMGGYNYYRGADGKVYEYKGGTNKY